MEVKYMALQATRFDCRGGQSRLAFFISQEGAPKRTRI